MNTNVEKHYQEFWKPIVENPDGSLNIEQVKKELSDFKMVMDGASKVYDQITGSRISKPNTDPDTVLSYAEEHYREMFYNDDAEPT